ncbi:hypothetical protein NUW54_g5546 [Trametes sanguinea]|uniref:Uncharacterized protein n=1 Tax=Trametes sanguinea TaxID=158606 RepID=A0ACC1PW12_9APHY|nr:hypothetical protein NUW54_g5546 [Trametes sanguinea]
MFYAFAGGAPLVHLTTYMFDFDFRSKCELPASRPLASTTARKAAGSQGRCAGWDHTCSSPADNHTIGSFSEHTRWVPSARTAAMDVMSTLIQPSGLPGLLPYLRHSSKLRMTCYSG